MSEQNARYENGWYYCWLIEDRHGTQPVWWCGAGWTTIANDAIWFSRRCDAENITMLWMHFGFPKDVVVCEHGFMLDKSQPQSQLSTLTRERDAMREALSKIENVCSPGSAFTHTTAVKYCCEVARRVLAGGEAGK